MAARPVGDLADAPEDERAGPPGLPVLRDRSPQDSRPDARGVLGTGVVIGHDHEVRVSCGGCAHGRPLAGVSVSSGAQHNDQRPRGGASQRFQRGGHGIGGVREVDDGQRHTALVRVERVRDRPRVC